MWPGRVRCVWKRHEFGVVPGDGRNYSPLAANMGSTIALGTGSPTLSVVKLWKRSVNMAQKTGYRDDEKRAA